MVIAIIGVLASVVLASVNSARAKARDARKIADFRAVGLALQLFFDATGRMPANYLPGAGRCEDSIEYNQSMQELITAGFLSVIPKSPGGDGYCWYNYGGGNDIGGLMVTHLETIPDMTLGIPPSCRPWPAGINWCDRSNNKFYCICNTY